MRLGLRTQFFLVLLLLAGGMVLATGGAANWSFARGFLGYLNEQAAARLEEVLPRVRAAYAEHGDWTFVQHDPRAWFKLFRPPYMPDDNAASAQPQPRGTPPVSDLTGAVQRFALLDAEGHWLAGYPAVGDPLVRREVVVNGRTVGYLVLTPIESVAATGAQRFQDSVRRATVINGALALALAGVLGWWLSRRLLAPVRAVAQATHRLAAGDHAIRVEVASRDEVGQLAADFNQLAQTLERNAALRREFFADVSHELRTPIAVLKGELEALEDGLRQPTPAALGSLGQEVAALSQLVDDLHLLALADQGSLTYRMASVDLGALAGSVLAGFGPRLAERGLRWRLQAPAAPVVVWGDEGRLRQLLVNLVENSCRYTEPQPALAAELVVAVQATGHTARLEVQDGPPGVPPQDLPHLFDRFFRSERSRSRSGGGSGLGLAISRAVVVAHRGQIAAVASPLGGVSIVVELPLHVG